MTQTASIADLLDQAQRQCVVSIRLGLERVTRLLNDLGDPQKTLKVVHVAGTNGKGSVLALLEAILRHAGYRVGLYTSPHLHRWNERIRVDGCTISDEQLGTLLLKVLAVNAGRPITFFELITAVALYHFHQQGLGEQGIVLLETGLGGRLDATNVTHPQLSIITAVGVDHTDYLGTTLTAIAQEKAGILKTAVPAVAAASHPEVERILRSQAHKVGTPLGLLGRDFTVSYSRKEGSPVEDQAKAWIFQEAGETSEWPLPGLLGRHQLDNAALAIAGIRRLQKAGWHVTTDLIASGLREARWPGRLEYFPACFSTGTPRPAILLDAAHNPQACLTLVRFLNETNVTPNFLIFSALLNKNVTEMVHILAPKVERVWTAQVGEERGYSAESLAEIWRVSNRQVQPCLTAKDALVAACRDCPPSGQVVVCGSIYLVGAIRAIVKDLWKGSAKAL